MNQSEIAERAREFVESHLVPPLLHGDEAHKEWLRGELRKWIPDLERAIAESQAPQPEIKVHLDMCPKCTGSKDMPLCSDMFHSPAGVRQTNDVPDCGRCR